MKIWQVFSLQCDTVSMAIKLFIDSRVILGCTDETIHSYEYFLGQFKKWLVSDDIQLLNIDIFNAYTLYLLKKDIKRVTVRTYLTHLRAFYHYLNDNNICINNLSKIHLPRKNVDVIDILSDNEVRKLILAVSGDDFLDVRNRLIVYCMLDCGFRRSDIINLKTDDIKDDYFIVKGKGAKERIVPYGESISKLIRYYKDFGLYGEYFFTLKNGERITKNAVKMLFQRLKTDTGIKRLKAHLLRHTFATNYLYNGGNLEMLRLILGHTDISTTQIYLHLAETKKLLEKSHISYLDTLSKK